MQALAKAPARAAPASTVAPRRTVAPRLLLAHASQRQPYPPHTQTAGAGSGRPMLTRGALVVLLACSLLLAPVAHSMSPLLGGKSERAVDDHATQLAHFAVGEIGAKANVDGLSLVRVTKLSTQVVAGMKYYFDLETKDKAGATRHYEAQVWEKPGGYDNSAPELTSYKETSQATAGGAAAAGGSGGGGAMSADWHAAAAEAAVAQINMRSNSLIPYTLVAISPAAGASGGDPPDSAKMVLQLARGDKRESMEVHVERREGGRYGLKSFAPLN